MSSASEHIAGWQAAGLLDAETADRLRAAATTEPDHPVEPPATAATQSAASRMFGPSVQIPEVFGYLGGGFVVAAWSAFMATTAATTDDPGIILGVLGLLAAGVLTALGIRLGVGDARSSRAAGVVLLTALAFVAAAAFSLLSEGGVETRLAGVMVSAVVVMVSVVYRMIHPSVLTQVGILAALTALAGSFLSWLQATVFPEEVNDLTGVVSSSGPDPIILVIASAAFWLVVAVGIGLLGLAEARGAGRPSDPTAAGRAAVTRFWAGLLAVIGLATAVSRSGPLPEGEYGRLLEPIVGDIALLILAAILVERAFRRDATSYIYAAALGLIVALTDFNLSYLSDSPAAGLLVEGLILLGVGIGADRLRKRVGQAGAGAGTPPEDFDRVAEPMPTPESAVPAPEAT